MRNLDDFLLAYGGIWTAEHGATGVASAGVLAVGFVTGINPMVAMRRAYSSSGNLLTITLYEVAFTGGTNILRTYNRNLGSSRPAPTQMKAGVTFTPNTPISSLTARGATSTGNANVVVPDENQLILKKATSYVLTLTNGDAAAADLGFSINLREQQLGDLVV